VWVLTSIGWSVTSVINTCRAGGESLLVFGAPGVELVTVSLVTVTA
jgi:hypothetical protein